MPNGTNVTTDVIWAIFRKSVEYYHLEHSDCAQDPTSIEKAKRGDQEACTRPISIRKIPRFKRIYRGNNRDQQQNDSTQYAKHNSPNGCPVLVRSVARIHSHIPNEHGIHDR